MSATGTLYIVSAPSGAGKTSLLTAVHNQLPDLKVAVSHTTRQARPGEEDGQHYHFVSVEKFKKIRDAGDFLEYAEVFGNYYGTSKQAVNNLLDAGEQVVLEIDWQGAQQVRKVYPDAVSIFILPPSVEELEHRLKARGQDSQQVIDARMAQAQSEISHYHEYEYIVINDELELAIETLIGIFSKPPRYQSPNSDKLDEFLRSLA